MTREALLQKAREWLQANLKLRARLAEPDNGYSADDQDAHLLADFFLSELPALRKILDPTGLNTR